MSMNDTTRQVIPIAVGVLFVVGACITFAMVVVHRGANEPRQTLAHRAVTDFTGALDRYRKDTGSYPPTGLGLTALRDPPEGVQNWQGPYVSHEVHNDPWGRPYYYKYPGDHGEKPDVASYGTDGRPGGEGVNADIVSWRTH